MGGGVEWLFAPNWSLKAEGIYWNLGNLNVPTYSFAPAVLPSSSSNFIGTVPSASYGNTRVNYQDVIARVGVNYNFVSGASVPVIARY